MELEGSLVFPTSRHLFLSWARSTQSAVLQPVCWRFTFILFSHLCLLLSRGLLSPPKFCMQLLSALCPIHATFPAHLLLLCLISQIILREQYRSWCSLLCSVLHSSVTSSHSGPHIFLSTLSRTNYGVPLYTVFSSLLLLPPFRHIYLPANLSSNAFKLYFRFTWETKFLTHTQQHAKWYCAIFECSYP